MTFLKPVCDVRSSADIATFIDMLSYKRPAGSDTEAEFIAKFIKPLGVHVDGFGNMWLPIDNPDSSASPILWSSHTDSVHHNAGRQQVLVSVSGLATLADAKGKKGQKSNCLGADCATGVWLMREMILAKVPGLYVFHREEESGGVGSAWIAKNVPDMLANIRFAIALDRKGQQDVITHQNGERSASDAFAKSLARALNAGCTLPLDFMPCDGGVFTDTAQYVRLIPECTNLSVGYERQHGPCESQDLNFLAQLRDVLLSADFSGLVCERDPTVAERPWWDDDEYEFVSDRDASPSDDQNTQRLYEMIRHYPHAVARVLEEMGVYAEDLEDSVYGVMEDEGR